jgi:hypothetical protein
LSLVGYLEEIVHAAGAGRRRSIFEGGSEGLQAAHQDGGVDADSHERCAQFDVTPGQFLIGAENAGLPAFWMRAMASSIAA